MRVRIATAGVLLAALAWAASPASGQTRPTLEDYDYENLALRGIAVDAGYMWPNKVEPTSIFTLRLDLGYLGPAVRISPSITFWGSTVQEEELERLAQQLNELGADLTAESLGPIDWSDLSFNVDAQVVWETRFKVFTYAGAGVGIHALNGQGSAIQDTFIEDLLDTITAGVDFVAGAETPTIRRFRFYAEGRYTVMSDLNYPSIRFGGALKLPARAPAPPAGTGRP